MRIWRWAAVGGLVISGQATGQQPAAQPTLQQAFEAAATLDGTGTPAARLAAWEALERRAGKNPRNAALFRIRKAGALIALDRLDEAIAATRSGLAGLPASDPSLAGDRSIAWLTLAQIAQQSLDYAGAVEAFRKAEDAANEPDLKLSAWLGLYATEPYVDPKAAAATVARVTPLAAARKIEAKVRGQLARYDAERLLNAGDFAAAKARAKDAIALLGGLTERTFVDDVPPRSDAAIAALLAGDGEDARRYMAMTGAGRAPRGSFDPAVQMVPPDCGGDSGLKPNDAAVIEFSVGDDGRVLESRPVYAAGGGAAALEFARAARNWSWTPEQLKTLPAFFRVRTRVEMRCSTAFERPGIIAYLDEVLGAWLVDHGATLPPVIEGSDAEILPRLRAGLVAEQAKSGASSLALVAWLRQIIRSSVSTREESNADAIRALAILDSHRAPKVVRLSLQLAEWNSQSADSINRGRGRAILEAALADPANAADPDVRTALRIVVADLAKPGDSRVLEPLRAIQADPQIDHKGALWTAAMARLASLEQSNGNAQAAQRAFDESGLTAEQCALIDSAPKLIHASGTYPNEALQWGFEGWATVQYDVTADGRTANARTVVAYPPFIFGKAAQMGIAGAKYAKSYRPDGGLGCGGSSSRYRFVAP